ncbi:MAG: hypothetical protein F3745_02840 [Nitrospinae bacterium]|nr:hypothetical protein [Nitrospinota bacterium]
MIKRTKRKSKQPDEFKLFKELGKYVDGVGRTELKKGVLFSSCVRASFVKCYEFNLLAWDEKNLKSAFFWLPTLRGICEDLIVLNFVQSIPKKEREQFIGDLMQYETHDRSKTQEAFFDRARPHQPYLRSPISKKQLTSLEDRVRHVWRTYGWSNINKNIRPPTRQIAEKHGGEILATLYDYLYRLTSESVHFNVRGLFV